MAIFGTLEEMPLPELLTMLGKRTGKLKLTKLPEEQNYDLYLDKAKLKATYINEQELTTDLSVYEAMIKLFGFEKGIFEFQRLPQTQLKQNLDIPIDKLLLQTATAIDEMHVHSKHFPAPKTRFKSSGQVDIWLDDALYNFWQNCASLLGAGCNTEEIAKDLSLDIVHVQHNLYKLRSLGKIVPLRAFEQEHSTPIKSKQDTSLSKDIGDMSYKEIITWLQSSGSEAQSTTEKKAPIHQKGLVNRLLKALRRKQ